LQSRSATSASWQRQSMHHCLQMMTTSSSIKQPASPSSSQQVQAAASNACGATRGAVVMCRACSAVAGASGYPG
jgi:hypothetical protein